MNSKETAGSGAAFSGLPPDSHDLYDFHDPIPVPHAVERFSDTSWALWSEMHEKHEAMFAETLPCSMPTPLTTKPSGDAVGVATRHVPQMPGLTVEAVVAEARRNARVCPRPGPWQKLFEMLPNKQRTAAGWRPSPPLSAQACLSLPSLPKRLCLLEQFEWAAAQGCLGEVHAFLSNLPEADWYHLGD